MCFVSAQGRAQHDRAALIDWRSGASDSILGGNPSIWAHFFEASLSFDCLFHVVMVLCRT